MRITIDDFKVDDKKYKTKRLNVQNQTSTLMNQTMGP